MDFPFASFSDALLLLVGVAVLVRGKRMVNYIFDAVAARLVKSINGALGLDGIREDIAEMKRQTAEMPDLRIQVQNLERQIEPLLE